MQYRPVQFPTGEVRATTAALANVSKEKLIRLVNRHIRGDWGDTYMADQKANEQAIRDGERILSWYQISGKIRILIITEADRSATTIMLPWCSVYWSPMRSISRASRQHKKLP